MSTGYYGTSTVTNVTLQQAIDAAAASEANAATSEANAATSEANASTSETNSSTSASNASTSASNASTSETNAEFWAGQAGGSSRTMDFNQTGTLVKSATWMIDSTSVRSRAMPTSPSEGDEVGFTDDAGLAATNNATLTVTGPTQIMGTGLTTFTVNSNYTRGVLKYYAAGDDWRLVL